MLAVAETRSGIWMMMKQKRAQVLRPLGLLLFGMLLIAHPAGALAQSIVVMVNGAPVTSFDLAQRQHFLALTSGGGGERMKAAFQSEETKQAFREFMEKEHPTTQEEAQELQKKFVGQLQQKIMSEASGAMRKQALEQLIDERLMLQAATNLKIVVTDKEVDERLTAMAQGGQQKLSLKDFLGQFTERGINPKTLREKIRAQMAWAQVVRQVYGSRVQQAVSTVTSTSEGDEAAATVDVNLVRFAVASGTDQKAVAKRLMDAEAFRKRFTGCAQLPTLIQGVEGVSLKSVNKAKLSDFPGDQRAAIQKAQVGQMTPPAVQGNVVEAYAICSKTASVASGQSKKKNDSQEKLQEEFSLYSRRHLKDLKDHARLDYPKNG